MPEDATPSYSQSLDLEKEYFQAANRMPGKLRKIMPIWMRRWLNQLYWRWFDMKDFMAEMIGRVPSHTVRLTFYKHALGVQIGSQTSVHRGCRFYRPQAVTIGNNCVINRDVLLDGRCGLTIGSNVSISEGTTILTLEHDPNSTTFGMRGDPVTIGNRVFVGAKAIILPGVTIGEGAVVAAGGVVSGDVPPFEIVGGVPAKSIGQRRHDLAYTLNYRKFLG